MGVAVCIPSTPMLPGWNKLMEDKSSHVLAKQYHLSIREQEGMWNNVYHWKLCPAPFFWWLAVTMASCHLLSQLAIAGLSLSRVGDRFCRVGVSSTLELNFSQVSQVRPTGLARRLASL